MHRKNAMRNASLFFFFFYLFFLFAIRILTRCALKAKFVSVRVALTNVINRNMRNNTYGSKLQLYFNIIIFITIAIIISTLTI